MTTTMGPPPPRSPNPEASAEPEPKTQNEESTTSMKVPAGPPPPKNASPPSLDAPKESDQHQHSSSNSVSADQSLRPLQAVTQSSVPYSIPDWSGAPYHHFYLEVLKDGSIVDQFYVFEKGAYMFGRADICDLVLEHPTISLFHAVLQFNKTGDAYLYDLGSTHGTSINKNQVKKRVYVEVQVGDVIRFGCSTRMYIFQGPPELMPTRRGATMALKEPEARDELAESLSDLFSSVSTMVKSELQGTNNLLELLEKMNLRVMEEYNGFGDVAAGLRVFVEQLKSKSGSFDAYVQQIEAIEQQVTEFEAVLSMLDRYVCLLESQVQSAYQHHHQHHHQPS